MTTEPQPDATKKARELLKGGGSWDRLALFSNATFQTKDTAPC